MKSLYLNKGKKDQKEYRLDISFNTIVDTDAMEQIDRADKIIKKLNTYNNAKKKVRDANKMPEQLKNFDYYGTMREFFGCLRSLLFVCLQDSHSEEVRTEKEAGEILSALVKTTNDKGVKEYTLFTIFDVLTDCIEECDFLSDESQTTEAEAAAEATEETAETE
jgi:hypothetical protein